MCASMKWAHLPVAGGLYDQHPVLLERFRYIFSEQAKYDEEKRKADERKQKQGRLGGRRVAGRGR